MRVDIGDPAYKIAIEHAEFDVSEAAPGNERCVIEGVIYMPRELPERPAVVVALPGATYSHRYWDLQPPGRYGYSQARYFAERGVPFVAVDYFGGGDRARPAVGERVTLSVVADAAHLVFEQVADGLSAGAFGRTLRHARLVGFGQSFGGSVLIEQQARYGDYAAVAMLGTPVQGANNVGLDLPDDRPTLDVEARRAAMLAAVERLLGELGVYHSVDREAVASFFYGPFVDGELIRYDTQEIATLVPRNANIDGATPGYIAPLASTITCPVFLGYGETDVTATPHEEAAAYSSSSDITISITPRMPHMHNFADTRQALWDRSLAWLDAALASAI